MSAKDSWGLLTTGANDGSPFNRSPSNLTSGFGVIFGEGSFVELSINKHTFLQVKSVP